MKAFEVMFYNGHFIDRKTRKRILPVQGKRYIINADDDAFKAEDEKLEKSPPKNAADKEREVAKNCNDTDFTKLLDAGTKLFYRVGNRKKAEGDNSQEYLFSCKLLEDLYMYRLGQRDGYNTDDWRLYECMCQIDECLYGNLWLTESVIARSLNELFSLTVMFYFNMQRSGATNVFKTFFLVEEDPKPSIAQARSERGRSIGNLRHEYVQKLTAKANTNESSDDLYDNLD